MYLQVKTGKKNRICKQIKQENAKIHKNHISLHVSKSTTPYVQQWVFDLKLIYKRPLKGLSILLKMAE